MLHELVCVKSYNAGSELEISIMVLDCKVQGHEVVRNYHEVCNRPAMYVNHAQVLSTFTKQMSARDALRKN